MRDKKPSGFILENVEGLVKHDLADKSHPIGRTLETILYKLEHELGYCVKWEIFDSLEFGLAQSRKRIFIVGLKGADVNLKGVEKTFKPLHNFLEQGLPTVDSDFTRKLLAHFELTDLYGKSIKDKRGGDNNIHSWDIGLKGEISREQSKLLGQLFKQRRQKKWALEIGIDWMDGMPLTIEQIASFSSHSKKELKEMLSDLAKKGYLKLEHPKKLVEMRSEGGLTTSRAYDTSKPMGYNIVTGKLSFEINKILDPNGIAPTLVATDVSKIAVPDGNGLRKLTIREGLRLFGYPDWYQIPVRDDFAFDLLGNTVAIPVVEFVAERLAGAFKTRKNAKKTKISRALAS